MAKGQTGVNGTALGWVVVCACVTALTALAASRVRGADLLGSFVRELPISRDMLAPGYPVRIALIEPGSPSRSSSRNEAAKPDAVVASPSPRGDALLPGPMVSPVRGDETVPQTGFAAAVPRGSGDFSKDNALRLLKLSYSIDPRDDGEPIGVRKRIQVNGADSGEIGLRISGHSVVSVSTAEVRALVGGDLDVAVSAALAQGDYVDLDVLRASGLTIRYDAMHDRILLSAGTP